MKRTFSELINQRWDDEHRLNSEPCDYMPAVCTNCKTYWEDGACYPSCTHWPPVGGDEYEHVQWLLAIEKEWIDGNRNWNVSDLSKQENEPEATMGMVCKALVRTVGGEFRKYYKDKNGTALIWQEDGELWFAHVYMRGEDFDREFIENIMNDYLELQDDLPSMELHVCALELKQQKHRWTTRLERNVQRDYYNHRKREPLEN